MDVAGAFTHGVAYQIIDELYNWRLTGHLFQVFGVIHLVLDDLHVGHVIHDIVNIVIGLFLVEAAAYLVYIFVHADECFDVHLCLTFDILDDEEVCRPACCNNELFAVDLYGHDTVAFYVIKIKLAKGLILYVIRFYMSELKAMNLGLGGQNIIGTDFRCFRQ